MTQLEHTGCLFPESIVHYIFFYWLWKLFNPHYCKYASPAFRVMMPIYFKIPITDFWPHNFWFSLPTHQKKADTRLLSVRIRRLQSMGGQLGQITDITTDLNLPAILLITACGKWTSNLDFSRNLIRLTTA